MHYLHQLVSSYLSDSARPLHDIYTILHSFCQSLQLEVLHSQVVQLCRDRLGDNVRVHDYQPGRLLSVAYWREVSGGRPRRHSMNTFIQLYCYSVTLTELDVEPTHAA